MQADWKTLQTQAQARLDAENEIRTTENPKAYQQTRDELAKERQRKRELKARQKEQAIKMHLAGTTLTEIETKLKVTRKTIKKWVNGRIKKILSLVAGNFTYPH